MNVDWRKVNPADLSVTCCADYYALSKGGRVLMLGEIERKCTFSTVIQASVNFSFSIYQMDIWVGYSKSSSENTHFNASNLKHQFQSFIANSANNQVNEPALIWEISA